MIRNGKRLKKKTIFDYVECRNENRFTDFVLADMGRQIGELQEELEAKDVELAEMHEKRTVGAYYIVTKDEYDGLVQELKARNFDADVRDRVIAAKDAEIIDLKSDLEAVAHESEVRQAEIVRQRDEAVAELRKAQRLQSNEAAYAADAVNGFSEGTTAKFADMAQQALDCGRKVSFATACAVVLKRELDKAKAENKSLSERNAELAKKAKLPIGSYTGTIIRREGCVSGFGPQTIVMKDLKFVPDSHAKDKHGCYINSVFDPCANGDNGR